MGLPLQPVEKVYLCHPELDSGSHTLLILRDAETSSAWQIVHVRPFSTGCLCM